MILFYIVIAALVAGIIYQLTLGKKDKGTVGTKSTGSSTSSVKNGTYYKRKGTTKKTTKSHYKNSGKKPATKKTGTRKYYKKTK